MRKLISLVVLMMVAVPVEAMPSYDPEGTADRILSVKDANKDGVISADEYERLALTKFRKIDADSDGMLSGEEVYNDRYKDRPMMKNLKSQDVRDKIISSLMKRWDTNGDLQISESEKLEPVRNEFLRIDRDLDKIITRDELISFWQLKQAELKKSQSQALGGN